jgi:Lon protease-like protein
MAGGPYRKISDLPAQLAVFPVDGALLLPGGVLPLQVFEPRYLNMVDDVMGGDRLIGMIQTAGGDRQLPQLARVGCAGRVTSYAETGDGKYLISLTGVCRFRVVEELNLRRPYRMVRSHYTEYVADLAEDDDGAEFERSPFLAVLRRYLDNRGLGVEWDVVSAAPAPALINSLSMALPFPRAEKQALLEAMDLDERRAVLVALMEMDAAGMHDRDDDDDAAPSMQ